MPASTLEALRVNQSSRGGRIVSEGFFAQLRGLRRLSIGLDATERLAAFLRRRHPFDTAWEVSRQIERKSGAAIPPKTIRNWLELRANPSLVNVMRLAAVYGPQLVAALYGDAPPAWLDAAARDARRDAIDQEIAALEAERKRLEEGS